ncbi:MAG: OmpA family protein [Betaproteobacteria bacterium]|nr:OmpA family protein [Betaproteobacteria bacterium]MCC7215337.1 OmpA family protein [Burkholderiales bacterium]
MTKKLLSTLIASLFAAAPAFGQSADDPMRVQGTATIGGIYNNSSTSDRAKLEEYQDLGNGALSNVGVEGRNSTTWFQGYGENFGRSDQYMFLRGGIYDTFKAGAYLNDIPHVYSTNAWSPYNGNGSNLLTATFPLGALPSPAPGGNWNNFTLGVDRRDAGGYVEWQKNSPWYFRADGSQVTFSGTKPGSAANGTSPGNGYVDLAYPAEFKTSNWGAEGGYQTSKATFSVRWDYSKFQNDNETMQWTNPYFGSNRLDTNYLAPGNEFNKFTLSGNYRDLPWKSVLSARYTWAKTTSDFALSQTALNTGAVYRPTLPHEDNFNGEHVNQSFALAWTAAPARNVDTRVYYYWTKLDNKSDLVEFGNAPTTPLASGLGCGNVPGTAPNTFVPGNCDNELYDYKKNNVGFDVWWKFARGQRVGFGWDYYDIDQTAPDYDKSHTNKLFLEYKNTMLDTLSGRLKYQYVKRDSDLNWTTNGLSPNDPLYLLAYTSSFNLQSATSNIVKLNLDWTPLPNAGVSFEGVWSNTDYDDVTFGRTANDKQGYFLSGNWNPSGKVRLNAFGSWEETKYPSNHRYIGTVAGGPTPPPGWCTTANPNCFSPFAPPFQASPGSGTASYNWNSQTKDETWMIGVGGDWDAMDNLKLSASYLYVDNEGAATFGYQNGVVLNNPPVLPINNFDSSTQQWFNLKGVWNYNKNWSVTGGYSYAKYSHDDIATNGYQYVLPYAGAVATNASLSYLNGYDAFTDGHQNIFYLMVTYKFDAPPLSVAQMKMDAPPPPTAKPAPPPPKPAPTPKPAPAPTVQKITLDSKVLFDFDKAVLKPEGKAAIDSQVVGNLAKMQKLEVVLVTGHTDRIGTEAYNQKLSERRADAVRDYLVSKGVDKAKIETIGLGLKQPVVQCDQKNFKALVECLAPNRRVEVQAKGEATK